MKLLIAADHAGLQYKTIIVEQLMEKGMVVEDLGTFSSEADDYPDRARDLCTALLAGEAKKGVLICGSGVGVSVAANKFKGIRAAVCHDTYSAHQGVEHDDMNVLCIGQRVIGIELALEIVLKFMQATFSNEERHLRRLGKILKLEEERLKE